MASYEAYLGVGIDASGAKTGAAQFDAAGKRIESAAERAAKAQEKLKQQLNYLKVAMAGFATVASAMVVRTVSEYSYAMSAAAAVTKATAAEMVQLERVTRELGATTMFSASQAAEGAKFLGMAGFTTTQIIAALPATLDLAAAASLDMGRAADITSNIMSGFGLAASEAGRAADVLAAISSSANTDVSGMGQAMKFVGPVAKSLGISMEETAAAIGVLANNGLQGGIAGRQLRTSLASLVKPSKDAQKTLAEMGLSLNQVNPQMNSLQDVVKALAGASMTAEQAFRIFGNEGATAMLALTASVPDLEKLTVATKNASGEAERMAKIMRDNLRGDFEILKSAASELALVIGSAGVEGAIRSYLQTATEWITSLAKTIEGISQNKEQAALFGDAIDALKAALVGLLAIKLAAWLSTVTIALQGAAGATLAWNTAILVIPGAIIGMLAYLAKLRVEIIDLEKYTRKQEEALLDMAGATGEAARQAEIATLQMRRAQMRTADEIVSDIANIQGEIAGIGQGYLLQNQAMLDQKRIKEGQLSQLQKELAMVESLKKKEDELVVKKITTSRAYKQSVEMAMKAGMASMGFLTGDVAPLPTSSGVEPTTGTIATGGSSSAATKAKSPYDNDGMMSMAFQQMGILKQESDKIIATFKQQEESKQKYMEGVKKQTEAEQKRLELTQLYGANVAEIDTQMQLYNATREYGIELGSAEYRQIEEQIRSQKQAAEGVKELEKARINEAEQAKKAAESQKQWNNQLTYAFKDAIMNSKNLGDALSNLANRVQDMLVNKALDSLLGNFMGGFAKGAAFQAGGVTAFASGGVVNSPTMFPMRGGVGLMGEAGAEAIMPLTRTSSGDLGVKAVGAGTVVNTSININVSGGTKEQNDDAGRKVSTAVKQAIDDTVISVILREKRPGGVLNAA